MVVVVSEHEERTTRTVAGEMTGLAAPSQGSAEVSAWRVRMAPGAQGPAHAIDREQVWMPLAGALAVTVEGDTATVSTGQAVILPAGAVRQIRALDTTPAEALVCMPVGGQATLPGSPERHRLPWAE